MTGKVGADLTEEEGYKGARATLLASLAALRADLDWRARRAVFEAKAPSDVLLEVRERLRALLGL